MASTTQSYLQQTKNRKGKKTYTFNLPIHEALVKTYIAPGQMEKMTGKYSKKTTLDLLPPSLVHKEKEEKFWTLRATSHHKRTMRKLAVDMIERYKKIVSIVKNIQGTAVSGVEKETKDHSHQGGCHCCDDNGNN